MSTPMAAPEPTRPKVRDRIFETACELFYQHGINNVGVDMIASEAGTNKMSFYRSFASKDELVAEYLRSRHREQWRWWDEIVTAHDGDPRSQIEGLFEGLVSRCRVHNAMGCAAANAAAEIRDESHPAVAVIHGYKAEIRKRFRALARAMKAREPDVLGDGLTLLFEGATMSKLTFACKEGPYINVAKTVKSLLDAHLGA